MYKSKTTKELCFYPIYVKLKLMNYNLYLNIFFLPDTLRCICCFNGGKYIQPMFKNSL